MKKCFRAVTAEVLQEWLKSIQENPCELEHTRCLYPFYNLSQCKNASTLKTATLDFLNGDFNSATARRRNDIADEGNFAAMATFYTAASCFPGCVMITTKQGTKRIDELRIFDEILAFDDQSGTKKWTTFYSFAHQEKEKFAECIVFEFSNEKVLMITEDHLLFVCYGEDIKVVRRAREVSLGMCSIRIPLKFHT